MAILRVEGKVQRGQKDFTRRMVGHREKFEKAVGHPLYTGTLNINVGMPVEVREHFRILGREIGEPDQDLIFEICRVNGIWAYRIRPFQPATGKGGHGDHIIEITCEYKIEDAQEGSRLTIDFYR